MSNKPKEMTMVSAAHGGFLVYDMTTGSTAVQPLFAGSIDDCVGFLKSRMTGVALACCAIAYDALLKAQTMGADKDTPDFLNWVADRLVEQYGENENVDFVHSLRQRALQGREALNLHESSKVRLAS